MKILNMVSSNGNKVPSQFIIENANKTVFRSYNTIIAIKENGKVILDSNALEYSNTTLKYLKLFLGTTESKKQLQDKIKNGFYQVEDLN